jgi:hypothetical protein
MEDMRLFRVIIVLSSLIVFKQLCLNGCADCAGDTGFHQKRHARDPTLGEKYLSMPGMLWNGVQYLRFNLDQQKRCCISQLCITH